MHFYFTFEFNTLFPITWSQEAGWAQLHNSNKYQHLIHFHQNCTMSQASFKNQTGGQTSGVDDSVKPGSTIWLNLVKPWKDNRKIKNILNNKWWLPYTVPYSCQSKHSNSFGNVFSKQVVKVQTNYVKMQSALE